MNNALQLFSSLLKVLASPYQQESFKALMSLLLEGTGQGRAGHASGKSPAALSRFLNSYSWNARTMIRLLRRALMERLTQHYAKRRGRRPSLYALIDLTTLEKSGDFPHLPILVLNNKRGLHLVVLYLVIGEVRFPWGLRVWRGKDTPSPSDLALRLLSSLPVWLTQRFKLRVLADGGFSATIPLSAASTNSASKQWWECAMTASSTMAVSCTTPSRVRRSGSRIWRYPYGSAGSS